MSKSALAFLAGIGSGYLAEGRRQEDKARQDKLDQIRFDEADRTKSEWDLAEKKRKDIADAAKDGGPVVDDAQVVTGLSTQPVTYQDKNLADADVRQGNRMLQQAPAPIAATQGIMPRDPATQSTNQATTTPSIATQQGITMAPLGKPMFQGKEYADPATAKAAVDTYNSPDARNARIAQAMRANGDHEGAMRMEANAKQAALQDFQMKVANHNWARQVKSEGVGDAYEALKLGDASGMTEAFNKSGKYKISGEVGITPSQVKLPDGSVRQNNIATFNIVKEDGTVVPMKVSAQELEKTLIKAEDFAKINMEEEYRALNRAWTSKEDDKKLASAERMHRESMGVQYAQMRQAEQHYQDSLPAGKIRLIESAIKDYTMPEEKRKEMLGIDNLDQKTRLLVNSNLKESDQLQAAMSSAMAKGEWQADSPGAKALLVRQAVLSESLKNMLGAPVGKKSADPLGLYGADATKNGTPASQPATTNSSAKTPLKVNTVPRASEYKGESDGQQLWNNMKSIASTVGTGLKSVSDNFDRIDKADQIRSVRSRIENNQVLSDAQKRIAIDNGLLRKD